MLEGKNKSFIWKKRSFFVKLVYFFMLCCFLYATIWFFLFKMENKGPVIKITTESLLVGKSHTFPVCITDVESGIRKVIITLLKDDLEIKLLENELHTFKIINHDKQEKLEFDLFFSAADLGILDGNAKLKITAWDSSLRNFGEGNKTNFEIGIKIDTLPPKINILKHTNNINQGGSGVVVYQLSKPCSKSGVMVGNNFFPGYSGHFDDDSIYLSFFALKHDQDTKTKISVFASDYTGNKSKAGFIYNICNKIFSKDEIIVTDQFLNWKIPEFFHYFEKEDKNSMINLFLKVNNEVRELNEKEVLKICSDSEKKILWEGAFLSLPRAMGKAGFADNRSYIYNEKVIDRQIHLGIDLASCATSLVPSANTGKVMFTDDLGIYGNTVVIDHGFGLFTLYSHLSQISVKKGETIYKGETIGLTGNTGLACGDHLHFSVMINNTFTNPLEWWDEAWIKNNITSKILF